MSTDRELHLQHKEEVLSFNILKEDKGFASIFMLQGSFVARAFGRFSLPTIA